MRLKKMFIVKLITILTILPLMFITACSSNYDDFLLKLKNKETFIAYIGSENCPGCVSLKNVWNDWLTDANWDQDILGVNDKKINRYTFVSNHDAKGAADNSWSKTFFETTWVKNIFTWLRISQKNLYKNNDEINKNIISTYLPENSIPMIFFVKDGKYRWFINKWGETDELDNDDMLKNETEFKRRPSYNKSTLTRLANDFIMKDFKDFYMLE